MNDEIRHDGDTIKVNDRSFSLSDIQDFRIVKEPAVRLPSQWKIFAAINGLATILLGVLKGLDVFSGEAKSITTLLLVVAVGINCFFLYAGIVNSEKPEAASFSVQMRIDGSYTKIIQSNDLEYARRITDQLKRYVVEFRRRNSD